MRRRRNGVSREALARRCQRAEARLAEVQRLLSDARQSNLLRVALLTRLLFQELKAIQETR